MLICNIPILKLLTHIFDSDTSCPFQFYQTQYGITIKCVMYTHLFKNVHVRAKGHPFNFLMLTSTMTHITIRLPRSVTHFHIAWYVCRKEMRRHIKLSKTSFGRPVLEAFMTVITHVRRELNWYELSVESRPSFSM